MEPGKIIPFRVKKKLIFRIYDQKFEIIKVYYFPLKS